MDNSASNPFGALPMVTDAQQQDTLASLTPEQLQMLSESGYADKQAALLAKQRAQVDALRSNSMNHYTKPVGAALGGISDAIRNVYAAKQDKDIQAQQQALLNQQKGTGSMYLDNLVKQLRAKQNASAATALPTDSLSTTDMVPGAGNGMLPPSM